MEPKFKIVLINHSFQINYYSRRWELFAKEHPNVEVVLFAPAKFEWYSGKGYTFGKSKTMEGHEIKEGNFRKRLFRLVNHRFRGWDSPDFKKMLVEERPDIIYHIGTHNMLSLKQVLAIRVKYLPKTKVISFSMRGPALNLRIGESNGNPLKWVWKRISFLYMRLRLDYINRHVDAFFCHYPDAVTCFRKEGYHGSVYMQTQVGVNEEWFHEDKNSRKEIRDKYGIADHTYVFGSATRFSPSKGIDVILKALPKEGDWKYLMMGSGSDNDMKRLTSIIDQRGIKDKVVVTGFVDWYDMAKYWNAVDCAIHVPLTTPTWEETFSLAAIQPQITKKPVIGDTSGSVPYQVGYDEMIVPEGDVKSLNQKICWVLSHKDEAKSFGERMYKRTHSCFEVRALNSLFYKTLVEDILTSTFDSQKADMTYSFKE